MAHRRKRTRSVNKARNRVVVAKARSSRGTTPSRSNKTSSNTRTRKKR